MIVASPSFVVVWPIDPDLVYCSYDCYYFIPIRSYPSILCAMLPSDPRLRSLAV